MFLEFDQAKNAVNQAKHGVSLAVAERSDWEHEPVQPAKTVGGEARWKILATVDDQLVAAIFTGAWDCRPDHQRARGEPNGTKA